MNTELMFSSEKLDWETPWDLFRQWCRRYDFTLDVCANPNNAKVDNWLGFQENGEFIDALSVPWTGRCWMNPPYGRQIRKWVKKAYDEALVHFNCELVACLLPARTDTKWFHQFIWDKSVQKPRPGVDVHFLEGRVKFLDEDGEPTHPAPFPSMIVVFKPL